MTLTVGEEEMREAVQELLTHAHELAGGNSLMGALMLLLAAASMAPSREKMQAAAANAYDMMFAESRVRH